MSSHAVTDPVLSLVVVVYGLAAVLPAMLGGYALYAHRGSPTARAFAATMGGLALWGGAYLVRLFAPEPALFPLTVVAFAGIATTPVALLAFALRYTNRQQYVTPATVALLSLVPVATVLLVATTRSHGLFYRSVEPLMVGELLTIDSVTGPWFWVHTAYSYALLAVASALLVAFGVTRRRLYRTQAVFIVLGVLVAWGTNAAFLAGVTPVSGLDFTPVRLTAGSAFLAVAVLQARLIDVTPVARDAVLDALEDVAIAIEGGRVVDVNAAGRALLDTPDPVGESADAAFPAALKTVLTDTPARGTGTDGGTSVDPTVAAWSGDDVPGGDGDGHADRLVELPRDGEQRCYRVRTLPLDRAADEVGPARGLVPSLSPGVDDDGPPATVLLLRDVTAQHRHLRQLRKQNERLEEFAAAAAHDLRNPLNVIDGYAELARETGGDEHFDRIDGATDRMGRLIDDLLALGRRGRLVESVSPVELAAVAEDAWDGVATEDATLRVEPGDPVPADRDRLTQLLENLFSNALEHGGPGTGTSTRQGDVTSATDGPPDAADDRPMPDDGRRERMASGPRYGARDPPGDGATDGGSAMDEPGDPVADRDGITVTVGRTDDGFYVADDGLGIPHEDRERVFDYGFTTHEGGSGFGLAVVETIADAHGWDVAVTESVVGGARFEVTGVDRFGRGRDPERPE